MKHVEELFEAMTAPSSRLVQDVKRIQGDIMILGAGGKVGPSLAIMAKRACDLAGISKRIIAVSLFDYPDAADLMRTYDIEVIEADLFDPVQRKALPNIPNMIYMIGRKFGTTENQSLTWAINVLLPSKICEQFPDSQFVCFSTGNVYGDVSMLTGGSIETDELSPDGEYGQTSLGRERVFEYYAGLQGTKSLLFRLNYAIDMRYGVLYDIADAVYNEKPVKLGRGIFNCIWQGDVCEYAIRGLLFTAAPPNCLNVTGPETVSTRWAAEAFGTMFGKRPIFEGVEQPKGIYSNSSKLTSSMGYPNVPLQTMMEWTAQWIASQGETIDAPTHFDSIDGRY